ncbi:hypothetical protein ABT369_57565 [Dactylosporangium sp. NPDC000244]|uniref:hypothetical protein n=1 Tax=Dactylosporangium sp. NPDC000244 TaxID=3154365 RepID=UPI003332E8F0
MRRTLDPAGHVRIHADDRHLVWRTDRVRPAAATGGQCFPKLEKLREDVLDGAAITFIVERAALLAAVFDAHVHLDLTRGPRWATSPPWASRPRWTCAVPRCTHEPPGARGAQTRFSQASTKLSTSEVNIDDAST